jgi:hypothetical protein
MSETIFSKSVMSSSRRTGAIERNEDKPSQYQGLGGLDSFVVKKHIDHQTNQDADCRKNDKRYERAKIYHRSGLPETTGEGAQE